MNILSYGCLDLNSGSSLDKLDIIESKDLCPAGFLYKEDCWTLLFFSMTAGMFIYYEDLNYYSINYFLLCLSSHILWSNTCKLRIYIFFWLCIVSEPGLYGWKYLGFYNQEIGLLTSLLFLNKAPSWLRPLIS